MFHSGARTTTRLAALSIGLLFAANSEAQTKAYVSQAGLLDVLDTATNTMVRTVPINSGTASAAISKDGTRAYVSTTPGTISVIDVFSDTVVNTIPVSAGSIALTPDGASAYVTNASGVQQVSLSTSAVVATIALPAGFAGGTIAITPDGTRAYVVTSAQPSPVFPSGAIAVVDTATNTIIANLNPGSSSTP